MALYTFVSFLKQIIYLKTCKKYIYGVIIEHKPLFHAYFCNIRFLKGAYPKKKSLKK